jgi:hypothetical protein
MGDLRRGFLFWQQDEEGSVEAIKGWFIQIIELVQSSQQVVFDDIL